MKPLNVILLLALTCAVTYGQEKGVDQNNARIRDSGNNRQPAVNGRKTDTGVGRGIDFGKGRTPTPPPVDNPYRFQVANDVLTWPLAIRLAKPQAAQVVFDAHEYSPREFENLWRWRLLFQMRVPHLLYKFVGKG